MKKLMLVLAVLLVACGKTSISPGNQLGKNKHNVTVAPVAAVALTADPIAQWALSDIGANLAWANGHTGSKNVLVGVIDEGFSKSIAIPVVNPDIIDNISTTAPGINLTMFRQNNSGLGIGTNIAGIIGAKHDNNIGTAGVCKDVGLVDATCIFNWSYFKSDVNASIQHMISLKRQGYNVVAILNAWDWYSGVNDTILASIKEAGDAGILYIRASGYHTHILGGQDATPVSPLYAGLSNVITVSAIDANGDVPTNANTSATYVDLFAPGEFTPFSPVVFISGWAFYDGTTIKGTPIAAAYVAGAVALYAASHPTATAAEIKAAVMNSTVKDARYGESLSKGKLFIGGF